MEYSLYVIKNIKNNKHYVGQTRYYPLDRIYRHITTANSDRGYIFHRGIRRYGQDSFYLVKVQHCSKELVNEYEKKLIKQYDALIPNGYNILEYGQVVNLPNGWWKGKKRAESTKQKISRSKKGKALGPDNHFYGKKHTEESRQKMSKSSKALWKSLSTEQQQEWIKNSATARIGHIVTQETRDKISKANKGRKPTQAAINASIKYNTGKKHTEETKQKMSQVKLGKKKSKETKQKMSEAQRKRVSQESIDKIKKVKWYINRGLSNNSIVAQTGFNYEYIRQIRKGKIGGWID